MIKISRTLVIYFNFTLQTGVTSSGRRVRRARLNVAACLPSILRLLRVQENSKSLPFEGRRDKKRLAGEARRGRETSVRLDDIAPRICGSPGPCYIRASFYFRLRLIPDVVDVGISRVTCPSCARVQNDVYDERACPGRCPQEVPRSGERS